MRVVDFVKVLQERQPTFAEGAKPGPMDDAFDELVMVDPDTGSLSYVGGIIWNEYVEAFQLVPGEVV